MVVLSPSEREKTNKSFQMGQQQNVGGGREGRVRKGHEFHHLLLSLSFIVLLLLSYPYKRVTFSGFGLKGKASTLERHYLTETECLLPAHPTYRSQFVFNFCEKKMATTRKKAGPLTFFPLKSFGKVVI